MRFESPWALSVLAVVPVLLWFCRQRRQSALRFPSLATVACAGRSARQRWSVLPLAARCLALALLAVSIARPQKPFELARETKKGIAIEMVLDRSPSMSAEMEFYGQRTNRLEVVKRVFHDFIRGDGKQFKGRPNDLVGIVAFAGWADTICPLTLAHDVFPELLKTIEFEGGGTAIGDAIALGAARLKSAEDSLSRQSPGSPNKYELKSKILILLTDGGSNAGRRDPIQAAQLAANWAIKIYTIGIGARRNSSLQAPEADEWLLQKIAETTGGQFRMADDSAGLRAVCEEIDRLERSEVQEVRFRRFKELFPPLVLTAFLLITLEILAKSTVFRSIP